MCLSRAAPWVWLHITYPSVLGAFLKNVALALLTSVVGFEWGKGGSNSHSAL